MRVGIFEKISDMLYNTRTIEVRVKSDVLHRAELMCVHAESQNKKDFDLNDFISLLYFDFIKYAVRNYNPRRVLKEATLKNIPNERDNTLKLIVDGKETFHSKKRIKYETILFKIENTEAKKGELILSELNDLYNVEITLEELICNLLTNYIEDYKYGVNKRAYTSVSKLLKTINF